MRNSVVGVGHNVVSRAHLADSAWCVSTFSSYTLTGAARSEVRLHGQEADGDGINPDRPVCTDLG